MNNKKCDHAKSNPNEETAQSDSKRGKKSRNQKKLEAANKFHRDSQSRRSNVSFLTKASFLSKARVADKVESDTKKSDKFRERTPNVEERTSAQKDSKTAMLKERMTAKSGVSCTSKQDSKTAMLEEKMNSRHSSGAQSDSKAAMLTKRMDAKRFPSQSEHKASIGDKLISTEKLALSPIAETAKVSEEKNETSADGHERIIITTPEPKPKKPRSGVQRAVRAMLNALSCTNTRTLEAPTNNIIDKTVEDKEQQEEEETIERPEEEDTEEPIEEYTEEPEEEVYEEPIEEDTEEPEEYEDQEEVTSEQTMATYREEALYTSESGKNFAAETEAESLDGTIDSSLREHDDEFAEVNECEDSEEEYEEENERTEEKNEQSDEELGDDLNVHKAVRMPDQDPESVRTPALQKPKMHKLSKSLKQYMAEYQWKVASSGGLILPLYLQRECHDAENMIEDYSLEKVLTEWNCIRDFYDENQLQLLSSSDYEIVHVELNEDVRNVSLGRGVFAETLLAKEILTDEYVAIKILHEADDPWGLYREFTMLAKARKILGQAAPKFKGFLQVKRQSRYAPPEIKKDIHYFPVMEFCSLIPDSNMAMTMEYAVEQHKRGVKYFSKRQWARICLSLLDQVYTLERNDIHHLDLKGDNILLRYIADEVVPVIIDYGVARDAAPSDNCDTLFDPHPESDKLFPQTAPELFRQNYPLPTSDLFSVALAILEVNDAVFKVNKLDTMMKEYRSMTPETRLKYNKLKPMVHKILKKFL